MKVLMTCWTLPYIHQQSFAFRNDINFLYTWAMSVHLAKRSMGYVVLHTDALGKKILVDDLELPFDEVHTDIDDVLDVIKPEWMSRLWCACKMLLISRQTEPFVHIDGDVLLWKPLPDRLLEADVFVQLREPMRSIFKGSYPLEEFMNGIGWVPPYYGNYYKDRRHDYSYNVGIFGGNNMRFIHRYSDLFMSIVNHRKNEPLFDSDEFMAGQHWTLNTILEQYSLSVLARHEGMKVEPYITDFFDHSERTSKGYEHLMGNIKCIGYVCEQIEEYMLLHMPRWYVKVNRYLRDMDGHLFGMKRDDNGHMKKH